MTSFRDLGGGGGVGRGGGGGGGGGCALLALAAPEKSESESEDQGSFVLAVGFPSGPIPAPCSTKSNSRQIQPNRHRSLKYLSHLFKKLHKLLSNVRQLLPEALGPRCRPPLLGILAPLFFKVVEEVTCIRNNGEIKVRS
jgi:hypothetical protein